MMRDPEFERFLTDWISEGPERAPADDVAAALDAIATIPQHRGLRVRFGVPTWRPHTTRLIIIVGLLLAAALGLAVGVGSGIIRLAPLPPPEPPALTIDPPLRPIRIEDWAVRLSIPPTWTQLDPACCDARTFGGDDPAGRLSVGHGSPYASSVCDPTCHPIEIPATIPYSATKQLRALKAAVERIAGSADWAPSLLARAQVAAAEQLETSVVEADGRRWRRIHIVGLRERNVVAIAWSQPEDSWDPGLRDAALASIELTAAPVYSDGDLIDLAGDEFAIRLPGLWATELQPTTDGEPLSGVRLFDEGRVAVSIGDGQGTVGLCDPDCRRLTGQSSIEALEASLRAQHDLEPSRPVTLGGEVARSLSGTGREGLRFVIALHDGRPAVVMLDAGAWDVGPGVFDEMIASFRFLDAVPTLVTRIITMADGRVELGLTEEWDGSNLVAGKLLRRFPPSRDQQELTVMVGAADGSIRTCETPAAPWEDCRDIVATTLGQLRDAVQPLPVDDHGVRHEGATNDDVEIGGEPGIVTRIRAYEYPARGAQEVVYLLALHDGRPYIIRIWSSRDEAAGVGSIIAGLRFVD